MLGDLSEPVSECVPARKGAMERRRPLHVCQALIGRPLAETPIPSLPRREVENVEPVCRSCVHPH